MITDPTLSVADEAIRDAFRRALAEHSLRAVAREARLTPSGLQKALRRSARWRDTTRRKLVEWYVRAAGAERASEPDATTVKAALHLILAGVSGEQRRAAVSAILSLVEAVQLAGGAPAPGWITSVREEL